MSLAPANMLGMIHLVEILFLKREKQVKQGPAQSCLPVTNKSLTQPSPFDRLGRAHYPCPCVAYMKFSLVTLLEMMRWGDGGGDGHEDDSGSDNDIMIFQNAPNFPGQSSPGSNIVLAKLWGQEIS